MYKLVPWLVSGELKDGEIINRAIDYDRYEERLGFRPTGTARVEGRWLLLTPTKELVNVCSRDCQSDWGSGRIIKTWEK